MINLVLSGLLLNNTYLLEINMSYTHTHMSQLSHTYQRCAPCDQTRPRWASRIVTVTVKSKVNIKTNIMPVYSAVVCKFRITYPCLFTNIVIMLKSQVSKQYGITRYPIQNLPLLLLSYGG